MMVNVRDFIDDECEAEERDDGDVLGSDDDGEGEGDKQGWGCVPLIPEGLKGADVFREKAKGFVFRGTHLFATWPHVQWFNYWPQKAVVPESVSDAMTLLLTLRDSLEADEEVQQGILSEEPHDDEEVGDGIEAGVFKDVEGNEMPGYWHVHGLIVFRKRKGHRNGKKLDGMLTGGVDDVHGNYQSVSCLKSVAKYVVKDGSYVGVKCDADEWLDALVNKKASKFTTFTKHIKDGGSLETFDEDNAGFVAQNLKKLLDYVSWYKKKEAAVTATKVWDVDVIRRMVMELEEGTASRSVAVWLCDN